MIPILSLSLYAQDKSRIAGQTYFERVDTGWLPVHKDDFQYDMHQQLIRTARFDRVGEEWKEKGNTRFEYVGDSIRLEMKSEAIDERATAVRDKYLLDHNGKEVGVEFQDFDSITQTWVTHVQGEYLLDAQGRTIEKQYLRNRNGRWMPEDRNLFEYDKRNRMIADEFQMWENDNWVTHQRTVNHYDKYGKLVFAEVFPQDSKHPERLSNEATTRIEMTYDPKSRTVEKLIKSMKDGKWVAEFKRITYLTS